MSERKPFLELPNLTDIPGYGSYFHAHPIMVMRDKYEAEIIRLKKSLQKAGVEFDDLAGFGADSADSLALLELREAIDDCNFWPSQKAEDDGLYIESVRFMAQRIRELTEWRPMEGYAEGLKRRVDCLHPSPLIIHAAACIDALGGDRRIPRAWCPDCGALRVSVDGEYRWELAK